MTRELLEEMQSKMILGPIATEIRISINEDCFLRKAFFKNIKEAPAKSANALNLGISSLFGIRIIEDQSLDKDCMYIINSDGSFEFFSYIGNKLHHVHISSLQHFFIKPNFEVNLQ